jgi:hypothetical protein
MFWIVVTKCTNLGVVSPCIIIYSNKLTNQMHHSLIFIDCRLNTAQHVSGVLTPIFRSLSSAVAASGLPLERGGSSAIGRRRSGPYHHVPTVNQRRLLQLISSWWWAWRCPKHVELYWNDRQNIERLMHLVGWFFNKCTKFGFSMIFVLILRKYSGSKHGA